MKLSVIIPVFNEEKTVAELISKVQKVKLRKEIIVVNDGSYDNTSSILKKFKNIKVLNHKGNKGKGAAVRTGIRYATGDILLIQDADLEYNPEDYERLVKPIVERKAKVVYGSRLKKYLLVFFGKERTPLPAHLIANKLLTFVTNILYGSSLTDMETCYKVFKSDVLQSIKLVSNGFEIEPEITAKILKRGYKIYEVPIKVKPRGYEEGKKINWVDGIKAIYYLLYFRFFDQ
ncbi:glycosyl transferase [Candidatus Woesebacteria bacterium RIFCSPHIGHO2_01_FULL_44_21]|uniref:Glycosyl transferase n=1 Tax=Candidatus Woesebacteria bacterium RIFCSPHIGHO2_01_FULL_44_21 TaxID=1802503 RepID=A0A1F7YVV1_9BACT|nr:MAG: glycosyl transferase [Candidatus Woesebacteria bacterium RIFCSPHIGHO2_01_FULL_44_21]